MLETWSRFHSVAALIAGALAALTLHGALLAFTLGASFGVLVWLFRRRYTAQRVFGAANSVTLLRCGLALCLPALPSSLVGAALLLVLALDGVDGAIARRLGQSSEFGAHFDTETDALIVALACVELWSRGLTGAWVLSAGALRYVYVVALWLFPAAGGGAPRSRWGRYSFLVLMLGLIAPWLLGARLGAACAAAGCLVVGLSFARSFAYSYQLLRSDSRADTNH